MSKFKMKNVKFKKFELRRFLHFEFVWIYINIKSVYLLTGQDI